MKVNRVEKESVVNRALNRHGLRERYEDKINLILEDLEYWEIVESLIETLDALKARGVSINDLAYVRASNVLLKVLKRIY